MRTASLLALLPLPLPILATPTAAPQPSPLINSPHLHPLQADGHPSSSIGGLRLAHVFTHDEFSGALTHHHLPAAEHARRHLTGTYNVSAGCCSLGTERERVRTSAALNWHVYPPGEAYDDVFDEDANVASWNRQEVWDAGGGLDGTGWSDGMTPVEKAEAFELYLRTQQDLFAQYLLSDVDTASWDSKHEPSSRYNDGKQEATGVAMGVYEAANGDMMLVFRGSYSFGDFDNILKWMKDWILEKAGQTVKDAWEESGGEYTSAMKKREGNDLQVSQATNTPNMTNAGRARRTRKKRCVFAAYTLRIRRASAAHTLHTRCSHAAHKLTPNTHAKHSRQTLTQPSPPPFPPSSPTHPPRDSRAARFERAQRSSRALTTRTWRGVSTGCLRATSRSTGTGRSRR